MEARPPKRRKLHRLYDKQLQVATLVQYLISRVQILISSRMLQAQAGLVQQAQALLAEELPADSSPEPVVATVVGEDPGELDDGAWLDQLPNDTLAALQLLRAQFPAKLLNKVFFHTVCISGPKGLLVAQLVCQYWSATAPCC